MTWISASHNKMLVEIMYLFISTCFKNIRTYNSCICNFHFLPIQTFFRPIQSIYVKGLYVYILQYFRISFVGSLCVYTYLPMPSPFRSPFQTLQPTIKTCFFQTSSVWKRSCSCLCNLFLHKERETRLDRITPTFKITTQTRPSRRIHLCRAKRNPHPPTHLLRSPAQNHPPKTNKRQNIRTQAAAAHTLSLKGLKTHPP